MKNLGSPAVLAVIALLLAAAVHPAVAPLRSGDGGALLLPGLALLFMVSVLAQALGAPRRPAAWLTAAGVVIVIAGLGYDRLSGHEGTLVLRPGEGAQAFDEEGPQGARLGLRKLDFTLRLQDLSPRVATLDVGPSAARKVQLRPDEAAAVGSVRLAWGHYTAAARLLVGVAGANGEQSVEVSPGQPGVVGDLTITVERYFPDFALDAKNQPFSRTEEPRNPGALLQVGRGGRAWRVFVLRAMPGIHEVPELGRRFSLRDVAAEASLTVDVHQEPAAPVAAVGALIAALGLAWKARA